MLKQTHIIYINKAVSNLRDRGCYRCELTAASQHYLKAQGVLTLPVCTRVERQLL